MKFIILSLFIMISRLDADMIVDPTIIGPIGQSTSGQMFSFYGATIDDLGLGLLETGIDLQIDLSQGFPLQKMLTDNGSLSISTNTFSREVFSPDNSPYKHIYPEADKAVLSRILYGEIWSYFDTNGSVTKLLGTCSIGMCNDGQLEESKIRGLDFSEWPSPLKMGSEWSFSSGKVKATGYESFDSYFTNRVDAEGRVITSAGSFKALRLSRVGIENAKYERVDSIDSSELFPVPIGMRSEVLEHYWLSPSGYSVVEIRQEIISYDFEDSNQIWPPDKATTIFVTTSSNEPLNGDIQAAVEYTTWGNIKKGNY